MKMIAAVGRNYEIGIANELPWRCSTDLKLFKRLTKNATVVMGRKTMESLKRPLPERHNLVLTRSHGFVPNDSTLLVWMMCCDYQSLCG
ncbi:TPA: dihydrofolate reductase [Escherichia coli]